MPNYGNIRPCHRKAPFLDTWSSGLWPFPAKEVHAKACRRFESFRILQIQHGKNNIYDCHFNSDPDPSPSVNLRLFRKNLGSTGSARRPTAPSLHSPGFGNRLSEDCRGVRVRSSDRTHLHFSASCGASGSRPVNTKPLFSWESDREGSGSGILTLWIGTIRELRLPMPNFTIANQLGFSVERSAEEAFKAGRESMKAEILRIKV